MHTAENEYENTVADAIVAATDFGLIPAAAEPDAITDADWTEPVITSAHSAIEGLIKDEQEWFHGVHKAANSRLYALLQRVYHLYQLMSSDTVFNGHLVEELAKQAKARNLIINPKSHTLNQIVQVVFGADRRRSSAYCVALRVALSEKVKAKDIPQFLRDAGGVEEVRRSKCAKPRVDKAGIAKSNVTKTVLASVTEPEIVKQLDTGKIGHQVVLIATQGPNGSLEINSVVNTESAVNSALVAIYNAQSEAWAKVAADEAQASAAQQQADLMNRAITEIASQTDLAA
jgi:hypothetical protein